LEAGEAVHNLLIAVTEDSIKFIKWYKILKISDFDHSVDDDSSLLGCGDVVLTKLVHSSLTVHTQQCSWTAIKFGKCENRIQHNQSLLMNKLTVEQCS